MNITFNPFSSGNIHFLRDNVVTPLIHRYKKICLIAMAAIGLFVACYLIHRCCGFNASFSGDESDEQDEANVENELSDKRTLSPSLEKCENLEEEKEIVAESYDILPFAKEVTVDINQVLELQIGVHTNLSALPIYNDSYFQLTGPSWSNHKFWYKLTRLKLQNVPVIALDSVDDIIAKLMTTDCSFKIADIKSIGKQALGLRHVSSHEQATLEVVNGVFDGCSLNISFLEERYNPKDAKFAKLHEKSDKEITSLLPEYENGIDQFIKDSITQFDLSAPTDRGATFNDILETAKKTRFLVLRHDFWYDHPVDYLSWGNGLGRFPKSFVDKERVSLLPPLDVEAWEIPAECKTQYIYTLETQKKIIDLLALHYRKNLLDHLRALSS